MSIDPRVLGAHQPPRASLSKLVAWGERGGVLSDLGGVSILVLRAYYDVYSSRLIHYMYYERIGVYYRYRNVIHYISMYYGVLDLEILIPYNTPLCRRDTCITRRCPAKKAPAVVIHVSQAAKKMCRRDTCMYLRPPRRPQPSPPPLSGRRAAKGTLRKLLRRRRRILVRQRRAAVAKRGESDKL